MIQDRSISGFTIVTTYHITLSYNILQSNYHIANVVITKPYNDRYRLSDESELKVLSGYQAFRKAMLRTYVISFPDLY